MPRVIKQTIPNSIIHDFLYCHILDKYRGNNIPVSQLLYLVKNVVRVPKSMDYDILKELEVRGFIKRINHQSYIICRDTKECNISIKRIKKYKRFAFW
jgi:hypothetical protein